VVGLGGGGGGEQGREGDGEAEQERASEATAAGGAGGGEHVRRRPAARSEEGGGGDRESVAVASLGVRVGPRRQDSPSPAAAGGFLEIVALFASAVSTVSDPAMGSVDR